MTIVTLACSANSGLGKEVATYVATKKAKLYMLCRSKERAESARDEIQKKTGNDDIQIILADLSEMDQVRKATEEFASKEDELHCIVCNAGVLLNDRKTTSEGREVTFAAHFLGGTYLLTKLLMPQLLAAKATSRVVVVTSGGMLLEKFPAWDVAISKDESAYNGQQAYSYAKRGQVLLIEKWATEFPNVKFATAHPGWAATAAVEDAFGDDAKYLKPMRNTWEGAEGISWLIGVEKEKIESGAFYLDRKAQKKHVAGPFFSEGSYTKNTEEEVNEMMAKLKEEVGI